MMMMKLYLFSLVSAFLNFFASLSNFLEHDWFPFEWIIHRPVIVVDVSIAFHNFILAGMEMNLFMT